MILGSQTVTIHDRTFLDIFSSYISVPGLDSNFQFIVKGIVLLAAVIFDVATNHAAKDD